MQVKSIVMKGEYCGGRQPTYVHRVSALDVIGLIDWSGNLQDRILYDVIIRILSHA